MSVRTPVPGRQRHTLTMGMVVATLVSVATTAYPATASTSGGTSADWPSAKVVCTSADRLLSERLAKDLTDVIEAQAGRTSLALYDRTTDTECSYDANRSYDSASVVKVIVLGTLLRAAQDEHRDLTETERKLAEKMITESDNDSTTTLWRQLGLPRINDFLHSAGMANTVPDAEGYWGLTRINAADEIRLTRLLTSTNPVLDEDSRTYALDLMNRVIPAQRWGTPAGAPSDAIVHVKNGWLQRSAGGWRVHSLGAFTGRGHDYGVVVLTADKANMATGVRDIEDIAAKVHTHLGGSLPIPGYTHRTDPTDLPTVSDGSPTGENGN
ncbi:serine hydrolase [Embleya sp. NPDC001921]